jgi:hypothetical protein
LFDSIIQPAVALTEEQEAGKIASVIYFKWMQYLKKGSLNIYQ